MACDAPCDFGCVMWRLTLFNCCIEGSFPLARVVEMHCVLCWDQWVSIRARCNEHLRSSVGPEGIGAPAEPGRLTKHTERASALLSRMEDSMHIERP